MFDVFVALLLAHVIADFLLQPGVMVRRKREIPFFLAHIAIVATLTLAALGGSWQLALALGGAHLAIDAIKVWALPARWRDSLPAFLGDQAAHLATLVAAAALVPEAMATGLWAPHLDLLRAPAILTSGAVLTVMAGGFAVGLLMRPYTDQLQPDTGSLDNAGQMIGRLERGLIFLFLCVGEPMAIGFLIAAKSVLRFDTASKSQKTSEYVIIGTLASFGWALATGYATLALLELSPTSP